MMELMSFGDGEFNRDCTGNMIPLWLVGNISWGRRGEPGIAVPRLYLSKRDPPHRCWYPWELLCQLCTESGLGGGLVLSCAAPRFRHSVDDDTRGPKVDVAGDKARRWMRGFVPGP